MATIGTKEAAARLGITARRVRALITSGQLTARRVGRDWLIDERSLKAVAVRRPGRPRKG